ncbi:hypothetical protein W02_31540 [Nitrospira sp. KM1]|uniref:hypothetical protein n=1 Tax=Nitrospira sp. KM1 TaxID=1936990 RepID=UPI0013A71705|nr:hypothetical protein [Nitrospira sp. KM1]BCA56014.1 hypothetical protein W02_31540 [Nitrospira sp. KM1]
MLRLIGYWNWKGVAGAFPCLLVASGLVVSGPIVSESLGGTGAHAKKQGDPEAGRIIFNGKGVCYYCHGTDGNIDNRPQLESDTGMVITQLDPQPADLRKPKSLRLKNDEQRAKLIREGRVGTGMFPETNLTNRELIDTLAYLAVLRGESRAKPQSTPRGH